MSFVFPSFLPSQAWIKDYTMDNLYIAMSEHGAARQTHPTLAPFLMLQEFGASVLAVYKLPCYPFHNPEIKMMCKTSIPIQG